MFIDKIKRTIFIKQACNVTLIVVQFNDQWSHWSNEKETQNHPKGVEKTKSNGRRLNFTYPNPPEHSQPVKSKENKHWTT